MFFIKSQNSPYKNYGLDKTALTFSVFCAKPPLRLVHSAQNCSYVFRIALACLRNPVCESTTTSASLREPVRESLSARARLLEAVCGLPKQDPGCPQFARTTNPPAMQFARWAI